MLYPLGISRLLILLPVSLLIYIFQPYPQKCAVLPVSLHMSLIILLNTMSWGDDDQDYLSLVTLILVLFIMMICVFGVLIVGFFNIRKILKSSLVFYGLLGLLLVVKLIAYLAFAIKIIIIVANDPDPDQKHRILSGFETSYKNGMFVSDFVIVELFLILMKEFHALQAESLLNQDSKFIKNVWSLAQILEGVGFTVLVALFNFGIIHFTLTTIGISILNGIPCVLYLSINLYANIAMTGAIADHDIASRMRTTNKRLFWFFLSRAVQGTYEIILLTDIGDTAFFNVILNIEKTHGQPIVVLTCFGVYLLMALLTEIIPYMISIRSTTIELMVPTSVVQKNSMLSEDTSFINLLKNNEKEDDEKEINLKDFETMEILSIGQNSFGTVKKGRLRGKLVVLRTIETQLSKYLLEEIASEIQETKRRDIEGLTSIRYSVLDTKSISFITDYFDVNVRKIIDSKKSLNQSIRLMHSFTEVLTDLHKRNLPHGTLKINNIYLSGNSVKIGDHGFLSLKKFLSITQGYSNKSIYTAPELLSGRHSIIVKPTKEGDIYAVGMIMFELFSGITVYRNLPLAEIQSSFKDKQSRPKIPGHLPMSLQNLIRNCWQQDPSQRPSIEDVGTNLREYKHKFQ